MSDTLWDCPDCDGGQCARCMVLDRCLAQVQYARDLGQHMNTWRRFREQYPFEIGRRAEPIGRLEARQVADRLIEWLAWPGLCSCTAPLVEGTSQAFIGGKAIEPERSIRRCSSNCFGGRPDHPLDGTPAAELRQMAVYGDCPGCDGTRGNVHGCGHGLDDICSDGCDTCANCSGRGVIRATHWPTVTAICDVLDLCRPRAEHLVAHGFDARPGLLLAAEDLARSQGHDVDAWKSIPSLWSDVHAWRPSSTAV